MISVISRHSRSDPYRRLLWQISGQGKYAIDGGGQNECFRLFDSYNGVGSKLTLIDLILKNGYSFEVRPRTVISTIPCMLKMHVFKSQLSKFSMFIFTLHRTTTTAAEASFYLLAESVSTPLYVIFSGRGAFRRKRMDGHHDFLQRVEQSGCKIRL